MRIYSSIIIHLIKYFKLKTYVYQFTANTTPRRFQSLPSPDPSLIFPFHPLPSSMHPSGFSFCFFPDFLAIFTLLLSYNNSWAWSDPIGQDRKLIGTSSLSSLTRKSMMCHVIHSKFLHQLS